jgi:hypothetical protein
LIVSRFASVVLAVGLATAAASAQDAPALVRILVAHESEASLRQPPFRYLAQERSERTGGHLWTENVVETTCGKVKLLIAEDGQPLNAERAALERTRLDEIAAHPDAFRRREQAMRNDEIHAKDMLTLLARAFLFDPPQPEGPYLRIRFRPDPAYAPQSIEERVLHGMTGSLLIEPKAVRLRAIEGRLANDVGIGFGLIASIRAGSSFATTRRDVEGEEWKAETVNTDIAGRAIIFKTIAKKQSAEYARFERVPADTTPAQAVALLER